MTRSIVIDLAAVLLSRTANELKNFHLQQIPILSLHKKCSSQPMKSRRATWRSFPHVFFQTFTRKCVCHIWQHIWHLQSTESTKVVSKEGVNLSWCRCKPQMLHKKLSFWAQESSKISCLLTTNRVGRKEFTTLTTSSMLRTLTSEEKCLVRS